MKESFWGVLVIALGLTAVTFIFLFQHITNTDEHNYILLKETTEAAMYDAFDLAAYRYDGTIRIDREKFVENFIRRWAQNATLSSNYVIKFYDVNELPPKVSIEVDVTDIGVAYSGDNTGTKGTVFNLYGDSHDNFDIVNRIDAILEIPY